MALDRTSDMASLTPAERAALYKQRASAAGIGRPPNPGTGAEPAAAAAPAPAPEAVPPPPAAAPAPAPSAAAPAAAPKPAAPAPPPEPPKPVDPPFVTATQAAIPDTTWQWRNGYVEVKVARDSLLQAARILHDAGFDYLSFVTEVDWKDSFEMLYHLYSYDFQTQPLGVVLRTELPREGMPAVASLTAIWPGAEFMERECAEMLGIRFLGHPDLRRILLPDDFVGYPMRKDYETDWDYITVKDLAPGLESGGRP